MKTQLEDIESIDEKIKLTVGKLVEKFPDCNYTVIATIWDDKTSNITAQTGIIENNELIVHKYVHYDGELKYETYKPDGDKHALLYVDDEGKEYKLVEYNPETSEIIYE